MTKKEYLKRAYIIDRHIKAKERQLETLKAHAVYVSQQYSDTPHVSSTIKSAMEDAAVKILDLEKEIAEQILKLVETKQEIAEAIKSVGNPEYECLLEMRYLSFMQWEEISTRLNYSGKYVFEVHGKALQLVRIPT